MTPTPKKAYCFTLNNYTDAEVARVHGTCRDLSQFAIFGYEVGEQGTPHLQGYIRFAKSYRFATIKDRLLPRCHIEVANGSARQNREYCSKSGRFEEFGSCPDEPERKTRDELAREFVREAGDGRRGVRRFAESNPGTFYYSGAQLLRNYLSIQPAEPRPEVRVRWFHGLPGVGKSRRAHEELPEAYVKEPRTKWWNNYFGEKDVIIDDFGPLGIDINHLLRWFDRYKCFVEYKGGMLPLVADNFIVTSNFHPYDVFKDKEGVPHPQTEALLRRVVITLME
ncbi:replication associated protein [Porcine faeces associated circular DNA molecule-1]|uniref:replication associated protein n=1 Tax=Porcine faeces associated circular DNA molecule-1 TaxID=1843772 RepID=UPI0007C1AF23|nr:replication associated protein [Porcine faeces associated circular DNA molecule-1]ANC51618.1 replication associated protein [Porcine faeces associated circular DNA molecule-1]